MAIDPLTGVEAKPAGIISQPAPATPTSPVTPITTSTPPVTTTSPATVPQADSATIAPASTYNAAQVQAPTSVADKVKSIIDQNSPLMQQASARANEASNNRGLINSSMAVNAAQGAVMDAATPIASADASAINNANIVNATATNSANQFGAQQINAMNTLQGQLSNQVNLANLDTTSKAQLANIQADYQTAMQTNASVAGVFSKAMDQISAIQQSSTMDAATKQKNINQALNVLQASMGTMGAVSGLNLNSTLNFGTTDTRAIAQARTDAINQANTQLAAANAMPAGTAKTAAIAAANAALTKANAMPQQ